MELSRYIEHTNLKPDAVPDDIKKLVDEAVKYDFFGVCINPCYVSLARKLVDESKKDIKVVCVVNFPLGANKINTTISQIKEAITDGADEIDTVINLGAVKSGNYKLAADEISMQKQAAGDKKLKVIALQNYNQTIPQNDVFLQISLYHLTYDKKKSSIILPSNISFVVLYCQNIILN